MNTAYKPSPSFAKAVEEELANHAHGREYINLMNVINAVVGMHNCTIAKYGSDVCPAMCFNILVEHWFAIEQVLQLSGFDALVKGTDGTMHQFDNVRINKGDEQVRIDLRRWINIETIGGMGPRTGKVYFVI